MTYKILSHWNINGLEAKVNKFIEIGYVPVGNVSVSMTNTYADSETEYETEYVQAVQKVAEAEENKGTNAAMRK